MPLTINTRKYQYVPDIGEDRYATDPDATGSIGSGNYTVAQKNALGEYGRRGLMRYKDIDAYFCKDCRYVFGVECARCKIQSAPTHGFDTSEIIFEVRGGEDYDQKEGMVWVITTCRKCSFSFRVLVR
jgi:hypothetical protein